MTLPRGSSSFYLRGQSQREATGCIPCGLHGVPGSGPLSSPLGSAEGTRAGCRPHIHYRVRGGESRNRNAFGLGTCPGRLGDLGCLGCAVVGVLLAFGGRAERCGVLQCVGQAREPVILSCGWLSLSTYRCKVVSN